MTDDLIERLRNFEGSDALGNGDFSLLHEAAAALEAAREDADDAAKWRRHLAFGDATSHSHRCVACGHGYSPLSSESEDCPVCLHDGRAIDQARGKGVKDES